MKPFNEPSGNPSSDLVVLARRQHIVGAINTRKRSRKLGHLQGPHAIYRSHLSEFSLLLSSTAEVQAYTFQLIAIYRCARPPRRPQSNSGSKRIFGASESVTSASVPILSMLCYRATISEHATGCDKDMAWLCMFAYSIAGLYQA
jgi:hypothetical protein